MSIEHYTNDAEKSGLTPMRILWFGYLGVHEENASAVAQSAKAAVTTVNSTPEFYSEWATGNYNAIILDDWLGWGLRGFNVLDRLSKENKGLPLAFAVTARRILEHEKIRYSAYGGLKDSMFFPEDGDYALLGSEIRRSFEEAAAAEGVSAKQLQYLESISPQGSANS